MGKEGEGSLGIKDLWIKPKSGRIQGGRGRGEWLGEMETALLEQQ